MASFRARIRARNQRLVDEAKAKLARKPDGSLVEADLNEELVKVLRRDFDADVLLRRQAQHIIDSCTKQEGEDDDDDGGPSRLQLELFGEAYAYDPERLIKDGAGNIIEEGRALFTFKLAEVARSSDHVARVTLWNNRKVRQLSHFQSWINDQMSKGRPARELTWGNCIRETGILRDGASHDS